MSSRRRFLVGCSAFAISTVVLPSRVIAASAIPSEKSAFPEVPGYADFVTHLNTPFRIHAANGRGINVTLADVRLKPEGSARPRRRPLPDAEYEKFSVVFSGRREELLEQNIYTIKHARLGRFEVFVVPILTRNPARIDYQVIFNRPRGPLSGAVPSRA